MIVAKNKFQPGQTLRTDICIIGGGPAAISIALRLANTRQNIIMVTGGNWSETVANQDLNRGSVSRDGTHEPLEENRRRQFGGASAVWGGRCIPFDPIDFEKRDWVPDSGWPFSYETILPYYHDAAKLCDIGDFNFKATTAFPDSQPEIINGFDTDELVSYPLERWSTPVNFAKTYKDALETSPTIQVLLDAHVVALQMKDQQDRINSVDVTMNGSSFVIEAATFVLAAGGIENPRLLLASKNAFFPNGLGNQHDNVGRYYMAHLNGTFVEVNPTDRANLLVDFERDPTGVYCRRRWWIPEAVQQSQHLLNTIFFLYHPNSQNGHRDVLFSSMYVAKSLLAIVGQKSVSRAVSKTRELSPALREHSANIAKNGLAQLPDMIQLGMKRMAKRRLPFIMPSKKNAYWGLYFQAEQVPNRDSRVYLSSERDAFGLPRVEVDIAFREIDLESVVAAHTLFVENFTSKNLGEVIYSEDGLRQHLKHTLANFNSAAHHLGTTRMTDDPETGVVDRNAKVYGLTNLFIAGSSVFPTGGHANPTLTIVAQALMLADHLKQRVNDEGKKQ